MAQHISIRVPWHDNGYCGKICQNPCQNVSCRRLKRIAGGKDEDFEKEHANDEMCLCADKLLPCILEGGAL